MSTRDRPIPADIEPVQAVLVHPPKPTATAPTARLGQRHQEPASTFPAAADVRSVSSLADTAGPSPADTARPSQAAERGSSLGGPAARLAVPMHRQYEAKDRPALEVRRRMLALFFTWRPGSPLAGRRRTAFRGVDRIGDPVERERQRTRLLMAHALGEAVGGVPRHLMRWGLADADTIDDPAALYFTVCPGPPLHERRRTAEGIIAGTTDPDERRTLVLLYKCIRDLTEPARGRGGDAA